MSTLAIKFTSLAIRTLAKPIANQIKQQAKDHVKFRRVCISIAQSLHRADMRVRLGLLRDSSAIEKAEIAEENAKKAATKEKEEEIKRKKERESKDSTLVQEALDAASSKLKSSESGSKSTTTSTSSLNSSNSASSTKQSTSESSGSTTPSSSSSSDAKSHKTDSKTESSSKSSSSSTVSKKRTVPYIRPLSDAKAIERGANFISETFLFVVAGGLILFEAVRSRRKEGARRDLVAERLQTLEEVDEVWRKKVEMLERRLDNAGVKRLPEALIPKEESAESVTKSESSGWLGWFGKSSKIAEPVRTVEERTATTPLEKYIKETTPKTEAASSTSSSTQPLKTTSK